MASSPKKQAARSRKKAVASAKKSKKAGSKTRSGAGKKAAAAKKPAAVKSAKRKQAKKATASAKPKKAAGKPAKKRAAKTTKAAAKARKPAAKKAAPKKVAAKKKPTQRTRAAAKKKAVAAKTTRAKRTVKPAIGPAPIVAEASLSAEKQSVVLAYPQKSTLEGAEPHAVADAGSAVIAIRSSKYELTPPECVVEPVYPQEGQTELPERYEETRLVVLVRDPEWLFLYWEIGEGDREILGMAPERFIEALVIRLHDVTEIEEFNGLNSLSWYEIPITVSAFSWYVHLPKVDREWVAELGVLNESGEFIQICRSNRARTPRNAVSEIEDSEWMTISEEFREILARSADVALEEGSGISTEAAIRRIVARLRAALERQEGSPVGSGLFRARRGRAAAERGEAPDLALAVRTELVVSGSTDPEANLTIQGNPVELRPDGSFTVRFELPDGEQILDVRAISSDGSLTREIVPVVQKETRT